MSCIVANLQQERLLKFPCTREAVGAGCKKQRSFCCATMPAHKMYVGDSAMNHSIDLPQSLLKRLDKVTAGTRTSPASIVKQAVKDRLDYEEWLLEQVDAGLADVAAGRVHSAEEMKKILGVKSVKKP